MSAVCPVYPKQQTFPDAVGTSHLCHVRTFNVVNMQHRPQHHEQTFIGWDRLGIQHALIGNIGTLAPPTNGLECARSVARIS
jgi:hypothetical protein